MTPIDLRSDTVTRPTPAMREAMHKAQVGDDVLGDDPTVKLLEERFAALLGKPAAVFVPSGTMGNQVAIRAQTEPGDEIIAHEGSHIIHYEGGGPAALSGCMVRALAGAQGRFSPDDIHAAVRPRNDHFARSTLLCIENTHNRGGGSVWTIEAITGVCAAARSAGMRCHLDGARLWNAHAASGVALRDYAQCFNTVTCCFSKGLGAPVGSVLAGDQPTIERCRRFRKMFGGGMRQSGVLAAACLHAMEHHVQRLHEDHAHARDLARVVASTAGLVLSAQHGGSASGVQTNIVLCELDQSLRCDAQEFSHALRERGVLMLATGPRTLRAVTHLDVDQGMCQRAAQTLQDAAKSFA